MATPATPPERIEKRVYQILPREAGDWVIESGLPQPPTGKSAVARLESFDPDAAIITPTVGSYIGGVLNIVGNARGGPFKLEIGPGAEPTEWTLIGGERGDEVQNGVLQQLDTNSLYEGHLPFA